MKIKSDVGERRLRGVGSLSQQVSQRGMFLPVTSVLGGHVIIMLNDSGEDREIDACISSQIQFYLEVERNFFLSFFLPSLSFSLSTPTFRSWRFVSRCPAWTRICVSCTMILFVRLSIRFVRPLTRSFKKLLAFVSLLFFCII